MKRVLGGLGGVLILVLFSGALSAAVVEYNDRAAWETAVGGSYTIEEFDDATLNPGLTISSEWGGYVTEGVWHDVIGGTESEPQYETTITFATAIYAFGADWDFQPAQYGTGITVTYITGETEYFEITDLIELVGFWGFVSDTAFVSILLSEGPVSANRETFEMDNMVYSEVPLPASILLLGSGLLGLAGLRRRRNDL